MNWLKVEFHAHTIYSKDSLARLPDLIHAARQRGIDRLIITDHNTIQGGLAAKKLAPDLIIIGEEILTQKGELIAAFVQEEIPAHLPPLEAIARLREQGAFISVSHPMDVHRGWAGKDLLEIIPFVDAIEVFNSRCTNPFYNTNAMSFAKQHQLAGTVGSDAHVLVELGRATMMLPYFSTAEELRNVISSGKPRVRLSAPWIHLTSTTAKWVKKVAPAWVEQRRSQR